MLLFAKCQEVSHFYHFTSTFLQKTKHLTLTPLEIGLIFKNRVFNCFLTTNVLYVGRYLKGSDQRENRGVWSNINTRYLVWRCGDGRSFVL